MHRITLRRESVLDRPLDDDTFDIRIEENNVGIMIASFDNYVDAKDYYDRMYVLIMEGYETFEEVE